MASSDSPRVRFTFVEDGVSAVAVLMADIAPKTTAGVIAGLPFQGRAQHGIYSGSEIMFPIPTGVWLPEENTTMNVLPGDLGYFKVEGGRHYGHPDDMAELAWFYDRDAVPSMPDGPVAVNLFGRFEEGWDAFAGVCRSMRVERAKTVRVELA